MIIYKVGYYFTNDQKDLKSFNDYTQAFDYYIEKSKEEFHKLGRLNSSLKIGYYKDNEFVGIERLIMTNDE